MASVAKAANNGREDGDDAAAAVAAAPRRGLLLPLLGSALLTAAATAGVTWFLLHQAERSKTHAPVAAEDAAVEPAADGAAAGIIGPALYLDLTPAFTVNLADEESIRFLQVEVELMSRDAKSIDAAKDHLPRIRNALLMLFAQQHARDLGSREAKEKLQKDALAEIQRALREEKVPAAIEAVYFTAFVMQ